jgi:protein-tyrosine phosphatase
MKNQDESDSEYDCPDEEPTQQWMYQTYKHQYKPLYTIKDGEMFCVRKVKKGSVYKKCNNKLFRCDCCHNSLCPSFECIPSYIMRSISYMVPSKEHGTCTDCDRITCRFTGICINCEKNHTYDMVTEHVAIGSYQASYQPFDVVINLDYPYNKVEKNEIKHGQENTSYVIRCGYHDNDEMQLEHIQYVVQLLTDFEKKADKPLYLLFHCYAGVSRSVTLAIAYLTQRENKTAKEIYDKIKQVRPRVNPNPHFRKLIGLE